MTSALRDPSRFAVVIGINEYLHANPLRCCVRDAKAMAEFLTDLDRGVVPPENLIQLYNHEATADAIRAALANVAALAIHPEDTVWIYYSGHGAMLDGDDEVFIVAHDAGANDDPSTFVSASEFREAINELKASRVVIALDCCHAGGFTLRKAVKSMRADPYADRIRRILDRFSGSGRFIIASCDAEELSIEVGGDRHGLFTKHLLDGLHGGADSDGNGVITPNEILQYLSVVEQQAAQIGHQQIFQFDGAFGANFVLAVVPGARSPGEPIELTLDGQESGVSVIARDAVRLAPEPVLVPRKLVVRKRSGIFGFGSTFESTPALDAFPRTKDYARRKPPPLEVVQFPKSTAELASLGEGEFELLEFGTRSLPCVLRFQGALVEDGFRHDLTLEVYWRISDLTAAARGLLNPLVQAADTVCKQQIDHLLQTALRARVVDVVRESALSPRMVREHAFTRQTWMQRLTEGNADLAGFELDVISYSTDSAEERAAKAQEREAKRQQRELELEDVRNRALVEHEERMAEIAREQELANARTEQEQVEAKRKAELADLEHRKMVLKLELEMREIAESRAAEKLRAELESERTRNDQEVRKATGEIERLQATVEELRDHLKSLQALSIIKSTPELRPMNAAAEFAAMHALGAGSFGGASMSNSLSTLVASRSASRSVRLVKPDLGVRDIGVPEHLEGPGAVCIPTLKIGSPLSFFVESDEPGFLTLLNFGTSGRLWMQTPNASLLPTDARIEPGARVTVPGERTVPTALLQRTRVDYVESGPPGWEVLVAIVSDRPLIEESERTHADPRYPFRQIEDAFSRVLASRLESGAVGRWSASVVSFKVVP